MKVKMALRDRFDVRDLKWISVWSEEEKGSLGELVLEDKIKAENGGKANKNCTTLYISCLAIILRRFIGRVQE